MTKKILAIIPARAGSKGIKNKNIIPLNNKPLISYTINAALKSKYITNTIVSSDSEDILNIAHKYGADIIKRPKELALDTSPTEPLIKHTIENINESYDYIILLQATSPFRDEKDIDTAIEKLFSSDADSLISMSNYDNKILKAFKQNTKGYLEGISNNTYPFMRRQDLPKIFMPNGAIYIIKTNEFMKKYSLFTDRTIPYIMSTKNSIDIDTIEDLKNCERIILEENSNLF